MEKPFTEIILRNRELSTQPLLVHSPSIMRGLEVTTDEMGYIYEIRFPGEILEKRFFPGADTKRCNSCGRQLNGYRGPQCRYCDGTAE